MKTCVLFVSVLLCVAGGSASAAQDVFALDASANPNFDGAAPGAAAPTVPAPNASSSFGESNLKPSTQDVFWFTWWTYHATFAADLAATGVSLGRGLGESNPLYTQFGNTNMAGVLGSAVAFHVVASVVSLALQQKAEGADGVWRDALNAAAIGLNATYSGAHVWGAAVNVNELSRLR